MTLALGLLPGPGDARAYDFAVDAEVLGQGYQLRAADGGIVDRRRLTTALGLSLWNLGPKDRDGLTSVRNQFGLTLSMRFDTDLGDYLCNLERASYAAPLGCRPGGQDTNPELSNFRPEILFGYLEGKNLFGHLDLRLGRQLQWDLFDLRAFDGLWAELRTPVYTAVQLYGGLNVAGDLPIDSPIYSLDGTSHTHLRNPADPPLSRPLPADEAFQPTVGFSIRSYGFRDLQARLSYRRSFSIVDDNARRLPGCPPDDKDPGRPAPCAAGGVGTIEDRLSYTVRGRLLDGRLLGWGGLRYDFLTGRFDQGNAGVRGYLTPQHSLSLEYLYDAPTWDGDSIFNVFATSAYNDLRLMYDGRAGDLRFHGRFFARLFGADVTNGAAALPSGVNAIEAAYGGTGGVRLDRRPGFARLDVYYDGGHGGWRAGADAAGRLLLLKNRLGLEGRLTYMHWADDNRGEMDSVGLQAGARYALARGILLHVLAEDNINRLYYSQVRLVALLDLSYYFGAQSTGNPPAGLLAAGMGGFPPSAAPVGYGY